MVITHRIATQVDLPSALRANIGNDGKQIDADFLPSLVKQGHVFCALMGEEVVGLLYWQPDFLSRSDIWFLSQITTKPGWRQKGIAVGLLRAFEDYARTRDVRKIFSDIRPDNLASLALMRKIGATESGYISGFDDDAPEDKRIFFKLDL